MAATVDMNNKNEHITKFYKCLDNDEKHHLLEQKLDLLKRIDSRLVDLREEFCYYVASKQPLSREERRQILWLIEPNTSDDYVTVSDKESYLRSNNTTSGGGGNNISSKSVIIEIGPRLNFCSPFSTNAVSILRSSCKQTSIYRLEKSTIYQLTFKLQQRGTGVNGGGGGSEKISVDYNNEILIDRLASSLYDEMVETIYERPVESFHPNAPRAKIASGEPWLQPSAEVDIMQRGEIALREVSARLGLFFDDWDINYYVSLFRDTIKRNPTVVECFDLAQSNSEHSRHWFFKGILNVEGRGEKQSHRSLIDMVGSTQTSSNQNNIIKFEDNSSAIVGFDGLTLLRPRQVGHCTPMDVIVPGVEVGSSVSASASAAATAAAKTMTVTATTTKLPGNIGKSLKTDEKQSTDKNTTRHIIFTAETHNFPTGVAPFPGASTGTGGRIRDVQATGRGAHVIAGTAGYSFGNLLLDEHELDWENPHELYPKNLAQPWRVAVEASNGASDYGNKFGEPIIAGFARSFGQRLVAKQNFASRSHSGNDSSGNSASMFDIGDDDDDDDDDNTQETTAEAASAGHLKTERWEYLKPIMFTGGIGSIDHEYTQKLKPRAGMSVAKMGGPVYRIGIGGGAASSAAGTESGGESKQSDEEKRLAQKASHQLNFNAVQRGDPEMEQKLNRVIRACLENRTQQIVADAASDANDDGASIGFNPILSIHDQGAGGNGNVLKEIVDPLGATIEADRFALGDHTVNILELWAAEYQESDAILACQTPASKQLLDKISRREKCRIDFVGEVENTGLIRLKNFGDFATAETGKEKEKEFPIDLKLDHVIGSMPRKVFNLTDYDQKEFLSPARLIESEELPKNLHQRYKMIRVMQQSSDIKSSSATTGAATGGTTGGGFVSQQEQMMENFEHLLKKVLRLPSVGSKRYLTTKVDRCVTGLIAGQQCLGPLHTPIGDYALVALSPFDYRGAVTSIGEQPIKGLVSPVSNATMSVAEALTNMMFCVISSIRDIKCSANWMWAAKLPGEGAKLLDACEAMCDLMAKLGIAVDGGKDSLSMSATVDPSNARKLGNTQQQQQQQQQQTDSDDNDDNANESEVVKSPGTLVISGYAPVPDIRMKVTPILKCNPKRSHLIYVNLAHPANCAGSVSSGIETTAQESDKLTTRSKFRLGGSAILQTLGQIGDEAPNIDYPELLRDGFELVQELIREKICTAGHDVSDGGLIVCALEMALASHCGLHLNIQAERSFRDLGCANNDERILSALFAEECAVVIEVEAATESELNKILARFEAKNIQAQRIGFGSYTNKRVSVKFEQQLLLDHDSNSILRSYWESTSKQLDLRQANRKCVEEEYDQMSSRPNKPQWKLTFDPNATNVVTQFDRHYLSEQPKVAVLREEGINGDREMIASLALAGFQVFDVTVTDLVESSSAANERADLNVFSGLVLPGGFSYADVFGSGRGWAASLIFNANIKQQLITFRRRKGTFSLGVCNGCQLMSLLGFLDDLPDAKSNVLMDIPKTTVRLEHNNSGRFECRFVNVAIESTTNSIMLNNMQDSTFGVWVAHGEGKFNIEQSVEVDCETRIALRYVDDQGEPTMEYPMNPNGSDQSVAGLCSRDGRHLAMMPHPERCTQMWQWPYEPEGWLTPNGEQVKTSPWMQMFVNAYEFCKNNDATM